MNKNADVLSRNPSVCLLLSSRKTEDPDFKMQQLKTDSDSIGYCTQQIRRDKDRRPKYQDTSSSEKMEGPAYGKVQHSLIINGNRILPSLSHEVLAPDELPSIVNGPLLAANSRQLSFPGEEKTLTGNRVSFEEPTGNTIA